MKCYIWGIVNYNVSYDEVQTETNSSFYGFSVISHFHKAHKHMNLNCIIGLLIHC